MKTHSFVRSVLAGIALGLTWPAAAQVSVLTIDSGSAASSAEYSCTRIVNVFTSRDCTYGRTQTTLGVPDTGGPDSWTGPGRSGGYYAIGSAGDSVSYDANDANPGTTGIREPDTIKVAPSITGGITIDQNGTPLDGSDDRIGMNFSLGSVARNVATGQVTRAVERWTSMDHILAPYDVDSALANGAGGFDYIIGARGEPVSLCSVGDPLDCFGGNAYNLPQLTSTSYWATQPLGSIGIERSAALNNKCSPGSSPVPCVPNAGATTTASFTGYSCNSNNASLNDCSFSALVWGALEDAGFDNLVGRISTDAAGNVIDGRLYWTQEYFVGAFGAPPGDNSWQGGVLNFSATVVPVPAAVWLFAGAVGVLVPLRRRVARA